MHPDPNAPVDELGDGTWQLSPDTPAKMRTGEPTEVRPTTEQDMTRLLSDDKDSSDSDGPTGPSRGGSSEWDESTPPVIEPGRVIFDKYLLIKLLGEGGMGQVWLVHNQVLDRKRALKLIWPHIAKNNSGWKRFQREARLMAKLIHPGAVTVYDFKRIQSVGFIEMEYVPGQSLDKVLDERKGQPMALDSITKILDQLCAVLQEAHGHVDENTSKPQPIIHRDLKPSNIMLLDSRPEHLNIKVLDYGIAKMINEEQTTEVPLTNVGEFLGTVGYSSPEQIGGGIPLGGNQSGAKEIDSRSDIYSVGVMLYQLLTGELPFRGSGMAVVGAHLTKKPPPMNEAESRPKVPPEVERVIMQCLEKDPEKRPQTARELAEKFRAAVALAPPEPRFKLPRLLRNLLGAAVAAAVVFVVVWYFVSKGTGGGKVVSPDPGKTPPPVVPRPVDRPPVAIWEPAGYRAVNPSQYVPGLTNQPKRLRRVADGVVFVWYKDGIYLPEGYAPLDPNELVNAWPKMIVREAQKDIDPADRVRFIRIAGKEFQFGDPRVNPIPEYQPRQVKVADFYIQETEITNGDIDEYLVTYPDDRPALEECQKEYKRQKELNKREKEPNENKPGRFAAARIDFRTAEKCAGFFGGRLPTEAEWEFVAKSCTDDFLWPWGTKPSNTPLMPARLFDPELVGVGAGLVKKYSTDKTAQGIFDMVGNVREWCLDGDGLTASDAGKKDDPNRECHVRGGSFLGTLDESMVFMRSKEVASDTPDDVGFRVVIDCPAGPPQPGQLH